MTVFEYIAGILSIVMGLAAAQLLSAIAETIKYRTHLKLFWVHTAWCGALLFYLIGLWWGFWRALHDVEEISIFQFLLPFQWAVFLYIATKILVPDLSKESRVELEQYFFDIKTPFFLFLVLPIPINELGIRLFLGYSSATSIVDMVTSVLMVSLVVLGMFSENRRTHEVIVVLWTSIYLVQEVLQLNVSQT